jgi:predicted O-methyltransferase YrrM
MRQSATTFISEISARELARLTSLLRAERLSGRHLEIGTAAGGTLKEMVLCYPAGRRPRFVVVDPMNYFPDQLSIVHRNLSSAGIAAGEVEFRISKSWPALRQAERANETYSFIFVDGSHKINHVTEDLAWTRLLEPGGLVCVHDYEPNFKGVMAAVDRFLARHANYQIVDREERLIVIRKTDVSPRREISNWDLLRARLINVYHQFETAGRKRVARMRRRIGGSSRG